MKLISVKFLKGDKPAGRSYTYSVPEGVEVKKDDIVQINKNNKGIVIDADVPEESITFPLDRLKSIIGVVPHVKGFETVEKPVCFKPNNDTYPLCDGEGKPECETCCLWVDLEPDLEQ